VADKIYEGGARPARGIIPATLWGHDPALEMPGFDLAKSRALLEQSGVPPKDWRITAAYIGTSEEFKNALILFRARLAQIGVTLTLRPGPWGKIWNEAKDLRSAPHLQSMTWWPTYVSPGDALGGLFRTEEPALFNLSRYANTEFDHLLAEGLKLEATDRAAATQRFQAAQRLLVRDAVAIFVADLDGRVIYRQGLRGVQTNPAYSTVFFDQLRRP
jgi:peptide/nickel transport system substrate-binding protein